MIERLPERVRTPAVARAVTSPSAVLVAGAGTAAAILAGLPLGLAAVAGAAAWAARVALAVPRGRPAERIEPSLLKQPWRDFVRDAQAARASFEETVRQCRAGPLRERLAALGRRLDDAVDECWRVARQGDALDRAALRLDPAAVRDELRALRADPPGEPRDRAERSLRAQLASIERLAGVAADARTRLRALNAQLDEAVARAVELSLSAGDERALNPLSADVDSLVADLEGLRQALEETAAAARGA